MKLSTPIVLLLLAVIVFTTQIKTESKKCNSQKDCEKDECCTRKFAFDNAYCKKKLEEKKNCLPYLPMRIFDDVYMLSCPCKEGLRCKHRSINSDGGILISYHPRCFPSLSGKPDSEIPEKPEEPNGGGNGGDNIPEENGGEGESPKEDEGGEGNGGNNPGKEGGNENGDSPKESDGDNGGGGGDSVEPEGEGNDNGNDGGSIEPEGSNGGEEGNESGGTDTGIEVEGSNGSEGDTGTETGVISPRNN